MCTCIHSFIKCSDPIVRPQTIVLFVNILAVESWLWNPDCGILAMESWLWDPGFEILAVESWLWSPGLGILALESWLWSPGCGILFVKSWLWSPGFRILAVGSWLWNASCEIPVWGILGAVEFKLWIPGCGFQKSLKYIWKIDRCEKHLSLYDEFLKVPFTICDTVERDLGISIHVSRKTLTFESCP